jgi:hypothetical protein
MTQKQIPLAPGLTYLTTDGPAQVLSFLQHFVSNTINQIILKKGTASNSEHCHHSPLSHVKEQYVNSY